MIGGLYGYAAGALVIGALGLGCYALYQKSEAAEARASDLERQRDTAIQAVKDAEADKAALKARNKALDDALVARDGRVKALEAAKRKLEGELNETKKTLPPEDQACLDRALPPALAERLRH